MSAAAKRDQSYHESSSTEPTEGMYWELGVPPGLRDLHSEASGGRGNVSCVNINTLLQTSIARDTPSGNLINCRIIEQMHIRG